MRGLKLLVVLPWLTGCASLPDVTLNYFAPRAQVKVSVVQALDCGPGASLPVSAYSISAVASYAADRSRPRSFRLGDLDGAFSDTSFSVGLSDDGRLKSINAETTGQAETIVKSAVAFGTTLAPLLVGSSPHGTSATSTPPVCAAIATLGSKKPLTLSYAAVVDSRDLAPGDFALAPLPESKASFEALEGYGLPDLALKLHIGAPQALSPAVAPQSGDAVALTLSGTESVHLDVVEPGTTLWSQDVVLPAKTDLVLPIPRSALFGKQSFALTLTDAGAISTLSYAKTTGVAGALNSGTVIGNASAPQTAAEAAAALKAQSDEIAQTARLARCRANPAACN